MKKFLFLIIAVLSANYSLAQAVKDPSRYAEKIKPAEVEKILKFVASDDLQGRATGSAGAKKAAAYIAEQLKEAGLTAPLKGSWFQKVPIVRSEIHVKNFSVNGRKFKFNKDFFVNDTYADRTISAREVVFIGYGSDNEIKNADLKNKVLLWINEDKPVAGQAANTSGRFSESRTKILENLYKKQPALIIAVNKDVPEVLINFHHVVTGPRLTRSADLSNKVPVFLSDTTIANAILEASAIDYDQLKRSILNTNFQAQQIRAKVISAFYSDRININAVNVIGLLPGTDLKTEAVVISAHYDHLGLSVNGADKIFTGADDDGSGTAAVLALARTFSKARQEGNGPRRSILFIATIGEENHLLGSEYYCEYPVFPLSATVADLNIDMIGRTDLYHKGKNDSSSYIYVIGSKMLSSELTLINETANNRYTKLNIDYRYDSPDDPDRFFYRSDQYNFAKKEIPVIFYFNGIHEDYHQPSDEVSKINFPLLIERTKLIFYTAWDLANRQERPKFDVSGKVF